MYAKPNEEVMGKVKDEKQYRAAMRAVLKAKKYGGERSQLKGLHLVIVMMVAMISDGVGFFS